jgi:hypothetical protein
MTRLSALCVLPVLVIGCASVPSVSSIEEPVPAVAFGEQVPFITLVLWYARGLGLTPDQVRTLETLRSEVQRAAAQRTLELQHTEIELQGLLGRREVNLSEVEARIRKAEAIRTELRLARIIAVEKAKAVLTAEQRQKVEPLIRGGP